MPKLRQLIAAIAAMLVLACGKDDGALRVEPAIGMENGVRAAFDPADESHFLIVEKAGAIVVWKRTGEVNRRALTIRSDAVDAVFDRDAIVSIHRDGSVRRWKLDGKLIGEVRPKEPSRPTAMASFDDRIVTADESGRIQLWARALDAHSTIGRHQGAVIDLAADPGRKTVVSVGEDKQVLVWRMSPDGTFTSTSLGFDGEPLAVDVDGEDGVLAIGGRSNERGAVELIDLARDARVLRSIELRDAVTSVSFSRLTGVLATNGDGGPVAIDRDGTIRPRQTGSDGAVVVAFSGRGDLLLALTPGVSVALYSMGGQRVSTATLAVHTQLPVRPPRASARAVVRPFGDGFVAATAGGDVTFTDAGGTTIRQMLLPDVAGFSALGVSEAKGFVAVAADNGKAWLCRAAGEPVLLEGPSVHNLAVSRSGLVALQYSDRTIAIRNMDTPQASARTPPTAAALVTGMAFVKDDVLALLYGKTLDLVHLQDGRLTPLRLDRQFERIAVSPDGRYLALGARDGVIALYDAAKGEAVRTGPPVDLTRNAPVADLAFSSREDLLASTHSGEDFVRLWDVAKGTSGTPRAQRLSPQPGPRSDPPWHHLSAAFARTTDRLLTLNEKGEAESYVLGLTPVSGGELRDSSFGAAAVAPDGTSIATADRGKAWLWKVDDGVKSTPLPVAAGNLHPITDVVFARKGTLFAATDWLGPVMVWDEDEKGWATGNAIPESDVGASQEEALFVQGGAMRRWTPDRTVTTASVDANDARLAYIPAIDGVVLGWEPEKDRGVIAVAVGSGKALTWRQETAAGVIAVAALADPAEPAFASASEHADVTVWRRTAADRWSEAYTVKTSDGTKAPALAFGTGGRLLVGTEGGTVEVRDLRDGRLVKSIALGNSVRRLGIAPRRIWAALGSRQIVFLSRDLELEATMTPNGGSAIVSTPAGSSANAVTAAITGRLDWWRRTRDVLLSAAHRLAIPWKEVMAALTLFGLVATILIILLTAMIVAIRPQMLAKWAMAPVSESPAPSLPSVLDWIRAPASWVRSFGHTSWAVDAWLSDSCKDLPQEFRAGKVQEGSATETGGNKELLDVWRKAIRTRKPFCLWIVGPDGCGKSALAFALAREALKLTKPLFPIAIRTDWEGSLPEHVRRQMGGEVDIPTELMVKGLARRGRILLVIDGLSECQPKAEKEVIDALDSSMFRCIFMIVTSCKQAPPASRGVRELRLGVPLEPEAPPPAPVTSPSPPATSTPQPSV